MTTKTKRTLATIDALAGVPHLHESRPHLVVPQRAWFQFLFQQPANLDFQEWWQTGRGKYDAGLLFKLSQ